MLPSIFQLRIYRSPDESSGVSEKKIPRPWELRYDVFELQAEYSKASFTTGGQSRIASFESPSVGVEKDTREWSSNYPVSLAGANGRPLEAQILEFDTRAMSISGHDVITTVSPAVFVGRYIEPSTRITQIGKKAILPKAIATSIDQIEAWAFQPFLAATGSEKEARNLSKALSGYLMAEYKAGRLTSAPFEKAYAYLPALLKNAAGLGSEPNDLAPSLKSLQTKKEKEEAISVACDNFFYSIWDKKSPAYLVDYFSQDHIVLKEMYSRNKKAADDGAVELGGILNLPYEGAVFLSTNVPEKDRKNPDKLNAYNQLLLKQLTLTWVGMAALKGDASSNPALPPWVADEAGRSALTDQIRALAADQRTIGELNGTEIVDEKWNTARRPGVLEKSGLDRAGLDASIDALISRFAEIASSLPADPFGARKLLEGIQNDIANANYKGLDAFEPGILGGYFAMQSSLEWCGRGILFVPSAGSQMKSTYATYLSDPKETDAARFECRLEQDENDPSQFYAVGKWHVKIDIDNPKQRVYAPNYRKFLAELFAAANGPGFVVDKKNISYNPKTGEFVLEGRTPFRLEKEEELGAASISIYAPDQLKAGAGRLEIFSVMPRPLPVERKPDKHIEYETKKFDWLLSVRASKSYDILRGNAEDTHSLRVIGSNTGDQVQEREKISKPLFGSTGGYFGIDAMKRNPSFFTFYGDNWPLSDDLTYRIDNYLPLATDEFNLQRANAGLPPLLYPTKELMEYFLNNYTDQMITDQFWRVTLDDIHQNGGPGDYLYNLNKCQFGARAYREQAWALANRAATETDPALKSLFQSTEYEFGREATVLGIGVLANGFHFFLDGKPYKAPLLFSFVKDATAGFREALMGKNSEWGVFGRTEGSGITLEFPNLSGPWSGKPVVPGVDVKFSFTPPTSFMGLNTIQTTVPGLGVTLEYQNVQAIWGQINWRMVDLQGPNTQFTLLANISGGYFWPRNVRATPYDSISVDLWGKANKAILAGDLYAANDYVTKLEGRLKQIYPGVGGALPADLQSAIDQTRHYLITEPNQLRAHGFLSGVHTWLYRNYMGTKVSDSILRMDRLNMGGHSYAEEDVVAESFPLFEPLFAQALFNSKDSFGVKNLTTMAQLDFSLPPLVQTYFLSFAMQNKYMSASEVHKEVLKQMPEANSLWPITDYKLGAKLLVPTLTELALYTSFGGNINSLFLGNWKPQYMTFGMQWVRPVGDKFKVLAAGQYTSQQQFGSDPIHSISARIEAQMPQVYDRFWASVGAEYNKSLYGKADADRLVIFVKLGGLFGNAPAPKRGATSLDEGPFHLTDLKINLPDNYLATITPTVEEPSPKKTAPPKQEPQEQPQTEPVPQEQPLTKPKTKQEPPQAKPKTKQVEAQESESPITSKTHQPKTRQEPSTKSETTGEETIPQTPAPAPVLDKSLLDFRFSYPVDANAKSVVAESEDRQYFIALDQKEFAKLKLERILRKHSFVIEYVPAAGADKAQLNIYQERNSGL